MKKILFLLSELDSGGAEKVTINIMNLLNKEEYEVHLSVINDTGEWKGHLSNKIIVHNLNVSRTLFSVFRLKNLLQDLKPDIVFSTLLRTHISLFLSLFFDKKPMIILRSPTSPKLLEQEQNKHLKLTPIMKFLLIKAYKKANIIFAQTDEMKDELSFYYKINKQKIKVFSNPLDEKVIKKSITNISNPFDSQYINIVSSGRLSSEKGFDMLITSFKKVIEKNKNFRLYIIGRDGGEKDNLIKLIYTLNLQNYIQLLGYQENPYKFYYYSDLYVLSSYREGMPNTVIENLYLKKPVVATKCVVILEKLIKDGENGYLVNIADVNDMADKILRYNKLLLKFNPLEENIKDVNKFFQNLKLV